MSYKEQLQPFDIIVVYNPKSWLHRLIYGFTGYKAGHAALYMGDDKIYQATSRGVCYSDVRNYTDKHKIYICRPEELNIVEKNRILIFCRAAEGKKYAFFQLIAMMFAYTFKMPNIPDVSKEAMVCSEFIAEAFKSANIHLSSKSSWMVSPADIMNSKSVRRIECQ